MTGGRGKEAGRDSAARTSMQAVGSRKHHVNKKAELGPYYKK